MIKFDKFLSWLGILAVGGCIASLFRIVVYHSARTANLTGAEEYWIQRSSVYITVFISSLFLGLGCLVVYTMRKRTRGKRIKGHKTM
jgi:H+/Cl- antiporter ClcA